MPPLGTEAAAELPIETIRRLVGDAMPGADDEAIIGAALSLWSTVHGFTMLCTGGALIGMPRERALELLPKILEGPLRGLEAAQR